MRYYKMKPEVKELIEQTFKVFSNELCVDWCYNAMCSYLGHLRHYFFISSKEESIALEDLRHWKTKEMMY